MFCYYGFMTKKSLRRTTLQSLVIMAIFVVPVFGFVEGPSILLKRDLARHGRQTTGAVVRQQQTYMSGSRGFGWNLYKVDYRFTTTKGLVMTQRQKEVTATSFKHLTAGTPLAITYLPTNPSRNAPSSTVKHFSAGSGILIRFTCGLALALIMSDLDSIYFELRKKYLKKPWGTVINLALLIGVIIFGSRVLGPLVQYLFEMIAFGF